MAKKPAFHAELTQAMPKPSKEATDYETEGHLRTLGEAADIISDPAKLKKVHKLAGRKHKAVTGMIEPMLKPKKKIKSIGDLKAKANEMAMDDDGDDE